MASKGSSLAGKVLESPITGKAVKTVTTSPKASAAIAAGVGGVGLGASLGAATKTQEKQAAVNLLVGAGINFDHAVELVTQKAAELA